MGLLSLSEASIQPITGPPKLNQPTYPGTKNSSIPARITRLPCEDIGKVCDHILVLCEHIAEVCEHIVVLCEHIGTVCEHIVVLCEHIAEVCDHIAKATFEKLDERWMKGG